MSFRKAIEKSGNFATAVEYNYGLETLQYDTD